MPRSVVLNFDWFGLRALAVFAAEDLIRSRLRKLDDCTKAQKLELASQEDRPINSRKSNQSSQRVPQTAFYIVPLTVQAHQFFRVTLADSG